MKTMRFNSNPIKVESLENIHTAIGGFTIYADRKGNTYIDESADDYGYIVSLGVTRDDNYMVEAFNYISSIMKDEKEMLYDEVF